MGVGGEGGWISVSRLGLRYPFVFCYPLTDQPTTPRPFIISKARSSTRLHSLTSMTTRLRCRNGLISVHIDLQNPVSASSPSSLQLHVYLLSFLVSFSKTQHSHNGGSNGRKEVWNGAQRIERTN